MLVLYASHSDSLFDWQSKAFEVLLHFAIDLNYSHSNLNQSSNGSTSNQEVNLSKDIGREEILSPDTKEEAVNAPLRQLQVLFGVPYIMSILINRPMKESDQQQTECLEESL